MKIIHPDFDRPMELSKLSAYKDEGVYRIVPNEEKERLAYFLASFEKYREALKQRVTDIKLYPTLPFSLNDPSWNSKQKDIKIVDEICKDKSGLRILDIGAWNGWLSNYLTMKGHNVVATDIFTDLFDGLQAVNHYEKPFTALQLLPDEIWRIQESFDLIIFNRNWAYIQDHQSMLSMAKEKLARNGTILFTGLTFYKNPSKIEKHFSDANTDFKKQFGIPISFFPTNGYLGHDDLLFLKKETDLYPYNTFNTLLRKMISQRNHQFAIYKKK